MIPIPVINEALAYREAYACDFAFGMAYIQKRIWLLMC